LQHLTFALESWDEANQLKDMLWNMYNVRGELETIPQEHGRYRLIAISEKDLTADQLAALPGKQG
jgi:hypothetical protein